jgi:hypothetical protein
VSNLVRTFGCSYWASRLKECRLGDDPEPEDLAGALRSLVITINALSDEDVAAIKQKTGAFCILLRADYVEPCGCASPRPP